MSKISGDIKVLQGSGKGRRCICWAHGYSASPDKYREIAADTDILCINQVKYAPKCDYFLGYDDSIWDAVANGSIVLPKDCIVIAPYGKLGTVWYHYHLTPKPTTTKWSHYRSGLRAVYIASEILEYDEVYLVGYDYRKHPKMEPLESDIRTWESRPNLPWDAGKVLDEQILEYLDRPWKQNIFQTNPDSRLQHFPVKEYTP